MDRRTFITSTTATAAAIGFGARSILIANADLKDEFDVLYAEAATRRRMMSISTHDRISGVPGRVRLLEEFIKQAQKQKGVVFMRKDEIARWALSASNVPHES